MAGARAEQSGHVALLVRPALHPWQLVSSVPTKLERLAMGGDEIVRGSAPW